MFSHSVLFEVRCIFQLRIMSQSPGLKNVCVLSRCLSACIFCNIAVPGGSEDEGLIGAPYEQVVEGGSG